MAGTTQAKPFKQYYNDWEKFDVEGELSKIQVVEDDARSSVEAEERARERRRALRLKELAELGMADIDVDQLSVTERAVAALNEKRKGNECFKAGEFEEVSYTLLFAY